MDQATKDYIDKKFAEQNTARTNEQQQAKDTITKHQKKVFWFVYGIAVPFMLVLLGVALYLLYRFQLRAFI